MLQVKLVGKQRLVLDLSCRQRDGQYYVVTDRWAPGSWSLLSCTCRLCEHDVQAGFAAEDLRLLLHWLCCCPWVRGSAGEQQQGPTTAGLMPICPHGRCCSNHRCFTYQPHAWGTDVPELCCDQRHAACPDGLPACAVRCRWQKFSNLALSQASLAELAQSCDEFLVHGVDVEGMQLGIDDKLVQLLGEWSPIPVTYAGGARTIVSVRSGLWHDSSNKQWGSYCVCSTCSLYVRTSVHSANVEKGASAIGVHAAMSACDMGSIVFRCAVAAAVSRLQPGTT